MTEKQHLAKLIAANEGNVRAIAQELGVTRQTVYSRLLRLGLLGALREARKRAA